MDGGEFIHMSVTFSKEELIQANQFRILSQRAIQKQLKEHEKIGVLFQNTGLDAVLMSYKLYEALVKRLNELEEILEDLELEKTLGYRVNTPSEEWIAHPEGVSTLEMYRKRQKERAGQ